MRIDGRFAVKQGAEGQLSLAFESGSGPFVMLPLKPYCTMEQAHKLARSLNSAVSRIDVDFDYSPAAKLGFGPDIQE